MTGVQTCALPIYVWDYATPNQAVYEELDDETKEDYTIFPDEETLNKCEVYKYLVADGSRELDFTFDGIFC